MMKINLTYLSIFVALHLVGFAPSIGASDLRTADKASWTVQASCSKMTSAISYDIVYNRNLKNRTERQSVEFTNATVLEKQITPASLKKIQRSFLRAAKIQRIVPSCLGDGNIWFEIEYISKSEHSSFYSQSTNEIKSKSPKSEYMVIFFDKGNPDNPFIRDIPISD